MTYKIQNRRTKKWTIFIETNGKTFKKILNKDYINVGWKSCPVYENLRILQCRKCLLYGHKTTNCKKEIVCTICFGQHPDQECQKQNKNPECYNCIHRNQRYNANLDVNHHSLDSNCAIYFEKINMQRDRIDYS